MARNPELASAWAIYVTDNETKVCVSNPRGDICGIWLTKKNFTINPPDPSPGDLVTVTASTWRLIENGLM